MASAYLLACSLILLQGVSVVLSVLWSGAAKQAVTKRRVALGGLIVTILLGTYPSIYFFSKLIAYGPADIVVPLILTVAFTCAHGMHAIRQGRRA